MLLTIPLMLQILKAQKVSLSLQMGIDNIELIAKYETFKTMVEKMGLTIKPMPNTHKIHERIDYEIKQDKQTRLLSDKFMPIVEVIHLPKVGKSKPLYQRFRTPKY